MKFYYSNLQVNDELVFDEGRETESHFKITAKETKPLRFKLQTFGKTIYNQVDRWYYRNDFLINDLSVYRNAELVGEIPNRLTHGDFRDHAFTNLTQIAMSLVLIGSAVDWGINHNYLRMAMCIIGLPFLHICYTVFRNYEDMV